LEDVQGLPAYRVEPCSVSVAEGFDDVNMEQLHREIGEMQGTIQALATELTAVRQELKAFAEVPSMLEANGRLATQAMRGVQELTDILNQAKGARYIVFAIFSVIASLIAVAGYFGIKFSVGTQ